MNFDEANLHNLERLWEKYGARQIAQGDSPELSANTHWPHRCWLGWGEMSDEEILASLRDRAWVERWLEQVPESATLPLWPMQGENGVRGSASNGLLLVEQSLEVKNWVCAFEQVAMYLPLEKGRDYSAHLPVGFKVYPVLSQQAITEWVEVASAAFGYQIEPAVIEKLLDDSDIQILMASYEGEPIASALLLKTGDIMGVHQVGVKPGYQGKGFARTLMTHIIAACASWRGNAIVLQASPKGRPLYDSLGFKAQFLIKNFQRV